VCVITHVSCLLIDLHDFKINFKTAIATPADEARQKLASGVITLQEARSIIDNHLAAVAAHGTDEDKVHLTHIVNQWRREVCLSKYLITLSTQIDSYNSTARFLVSSNIYSLILFSKIYAIYFIPESYSSSIVFLMLNSPPNLPQAHGRLGSGNQQLRKGFHQM